MINFINQQQSKDPEARRRPSAVLGAFGRPSMRHGRASQRARAPSTADDLTALTVGFGVLPRRRSTRRQTRKDSSSSASSSPRSLSPRGDSEDEADYSRPSGRVLLDAEARERHTQMLQRRTCLMQALKLEKDWRQRLYELLDVPESSVYARVFAVFMILLILFSVMSLIFEPAEKGGGSCGSGDDTSRRAREPTARRLGLEFRQNVAEMFKNTRGPREKKMHLDSLVPAQVVARRHGVVLVLHLHAGDRGARRHHAQKKHALLGPVMVGGVEKSLRDDPSVSRTLSAPRPPRLVASGDPWRHRDLHPRTTLVAATAPPPRTIRAAAAAPPPRTYPRRGRGAAATRRLGRSLRRSDRVGPRRLGLSTP